MGAKDAYSFPLYHRIGQVARPVIASRYWIVIVLILALLLYAPFLFSGFFQDDYGFRIQFAQDARERVSQTRPIHRRTVRLYSRYSSPNSSSSWRSS